MGRILPSTSLPDRIKEIVKIVGSAEKLARQSGVSSKMIALYAAGSSEPTIGKLQALAEGSHTNLAWLAAGVGPVNEGDADYPLAENLETAGYVHVPRYEVSASAGGGAVIHSEQIVDHLSFKSEWVHNALGVSVKDLALINVKGDSMEPTLSEGDVILINMSTQGVEDNAIYVLRFNGVLLVKRIQRKLDGSIVVKGDNPVYEPEVVKGDLVEMLNVVGRVVWCGRRM